MEPKLFILLALVASSLAGPIINSETCSTQCTASQKFGYVAGKTYEYDYTADVDTSMQGASEDKSGLQFTAKVYIDVISKCEMNLRLGDVRLLHSDPNAPERKIDADKIGEFKSSLEESSLAFSFQDGRIEELCTSTPEKTWVLNIKRGILSSLQNTMDDLTQDQQVQEVDVTGDCKAEYVVSNKGWYTKTIKKSKDLLACVGRHGYNSMMQGTPYKVPSEIQSLPLVKGTHECSQDISNAGILQSSVCEEQHVLRPFSRESSGAVTKTRQTLKYVTERATSLSSVSIRDRLPLTFTHANDGRGSNKDVESKLSEICISTRDNVQPDTPKLFSNLVHLMKALDSEDLSQIYQKVKQTSLCSSNQKRVEKFFFDAIPMLGTKASLRMMTNLINNKEVTGVQADMWLTTLAFIKNPTKDMLQEVKPLITSEANGKAMLGVSSLIFAYCQKASCENDVDVAEIVSAIEAKIGVGCFVDKNNLNQVIMSLRSLGNAGFVTNVVPTISQCMTKTENPMEVRLSAVQAFRRMPCSISRDDVMRVFRNRDEDSELRIAAYLALMTCPSDTTLSRVRFFLESEEVNQVGSFIWSHLTNLMETSSPLKQDIRNIINDQQLKKEFDLEKLKYSRNYEGSFFLEKLNTGASIDSNLIWSSKSFLPRSAMTNITFDLFGHSVNLLEIGGRMEGIEYFLESYFGPNGYFQEKDVKEVTKQSIKGISDNKMEDIDRQFGNEMDALKGDLYMRVFGNELMFARLTGLSDITDGKTINILDILTTLAKNQKYSFTQNYMFLDSSMIIPTIAGFPMNLTIDGSATIDLEASGKMDLRKMSLKSPSLSVKGYFKPSGSVQITSMMSVDAFVTKNGMKMVSTMYSSSSVDGHVELENGKVLSAQVNTPFDKMEVFNVKTAFFTVHRDAEREQKMITENRQTKKVCSGDKLSKITGLELCGELQYPNASQKADAPYFPLTGPMSAGVILYKRDQHSSYNFEYKFVMEKDEARTRIAFNTPGSKVDREMSFDCLVRPDPVLEISLISPWKRASIRGAVVGDSKQKQITGRLVIDNKNEYSVTGEWVRTRKGSLFVYQPYVEIIIPKMDNIRLSSNIEYISDKSLDGEITLKGLSQKPIQSKVTIISKKSMTSLKTSISFEPGKDYSFETRLQRTDTKKAIKLMPFLSIHTPKTEVAALGGSLEYKTGSLILVDLTLDKVLEDTVKVFTKLQRTERKSGSRFQSKADIKTPFFRTKGTSNFVIQKAAVITRISYDYVIPRVSRDKITVNSKINYGFTKTVWSVKGNGEVSFKRNDDYNVFFTTDVSNKQRLTNVNFDMKYGPKRKDENRRILVSSLIRHELGWKASDLDINADVRHLAWGVDMKIKGKHSHNAKNFNSDIGIAYGKKQSVSAALNLRNKSRRYISLTGDASLKWNDKEFTVANNFEQKNKKKFTNELTSNIAGHKTSVISDIKMADDEYDVSTDIIMTEQKPFHVEAHVKLDPRDFQIRSQLNNDHSIVFRSQYKRSTMLSLSGDVNFPSRRVTADFEAKKKSPSILGHLDIKWDAKADKEKQFLVDTQLDFVNFRDINGFFLVKSPLQHNKININRKGDNAHFDVKSDGKEQLAIDTEFKSISDSAKDQIVSSMTITTASRFLRYVKFDLDHLSTNEEYRTDVNVNWKPYNQVSVALSLKKPLSLRQLHGSFNLKTPVKGYESSSFELSHDCQSELISIMKMTLNENSMQLDVSAKKETDKYLGRIGVKSTISSINAISIDVSHQSSMNDISTVINSNINGDIYSLNMNGKHSISWKEATIRYTVISIDPSRKVQLSLSHNHQGASVDTIVTMSENSNNIFTNEIHLKSANGELVALGNVLYKNKQQMSLNGKLRNNDVKALTLTVSTPFSNFRVFRSELEYKGDTQSMTSSALLEIQPVLGNIKLFTSFNTIGGVSGNVRLETPFQRLPVSEITFSRRQEDEMMRTDIKFDYFAEKSISVTTKTLFKGQRVAAHISIATPFDNFRRFTIDVSHTPTNKGCITNMKVEYPMGKSYSSELTVEYRTNLLWELIIQLPDSKLITASLSHKGSWEQFVSGARLQYSGEQEHKADLSFNSGKKIHGLFSLQSPLYEDITASISHTGSIDDTMSSKGMIQFGKNKPLILDFDLINAKRIKATLQIKSPFMEDINLILSHKGKSTNFKSKAKFGWGKNDEIQGDLSFNFVRTLKADFDLSTPFKNFRKLSAILTHEGNIRNFKCQSELKIGKDEWKANVKSKLESSITTELIVQTPHSGYEEMRVKYTHDGELSNFICHMELSNNKKEITGDLQFIATPLILSATLQTPKDNYRNLKALISHKGSLNNFQTKAEVTYSDSQTVALDTSFNADSPLTASVNLRTPFAGYEEMGGKITHSGSINNFASRLETLLQKQRSQVDISFTSLGPIEGKLTLSMPNYELVKITASQTFESTLKSKVLIAYGTNTIVDGSLTLSKDPQLKADVNFRSTFAPTIAGLFEHAGTITNCKSNIKASIGRKAVEVDLQISSDNDKYLSLTLNTPFEQLKSGKLAINHRGSISDFQTTADLDVNSRKSEGVLRFSSNDGFQGSAKVITPLTTFREAEISFKHRGYLRDFECSAEYLIDGKKGECQLAIQTIGILKGRAYLKTPFTQDIEFNTETSGILTSMRSSSQLSFSGRKQHELDVTYDIQTGTRRFKLTFAGSYNKQTSADFTLNLPNGIDDKIELTTEIKTPISEPIIINVVHTSDLRNRVSLQTNADVSYSGRKQHVIEVVFDLNGELKTFSTIGRLNYNGKVTSVEASFDSSSGIESKAIIKSPISHDIILFINHDGSPLNFKTRGDLSYSGSKQHELSLAFSRDGSFRKFYTSSNIEYNQKKTSGSLSFDLSNGIQATAKLNTPLTKNIVASLSHSGRLTDFNSQLKVMYGESKLQDLSLLFKHDGVLRSFKSTGSVSYNSKNIYASVALDTTRDPHGAVTITTPFTDQISASFEHQGVITNFISHAEIGYSGKKQHDVNIVFKSEEGRKFGEISYNTKVVSVDATLEQSSGINARVVIKSPFTEDIVLTAEHNGEPLNFNSRGDISYSGKKQHEVSVTFEHIGDINNFRTSGSASYNTKKVSSEVEFDLTNGMRSKAILRTPYTSDIVLTAEHNGEPLSFNSRGDISYSGKKQHEVSVTFEHIGSINNFRTSGSVFYNTKKVSSEVEFDLTNGMRSKAILKTPYTSDWQAVLDHQGTFQNFKTKAEVSYGESKKHDVSVIYKYTGAVRKFQISTEIEYNTQRMQFRADIDSLQGLSANVILHTPIWSEIKIDITLEGELKNLNARGELTYSGQKQHSLKVKSSHSGSLRNFLYSGSLTYNDQQLLADLQLDSTSGISGTATLKIPDTDDISLTVKHTGNLFDLDSRAELSYSGKKHEITGSMKHTGGMKKIRSFALFTYNGKAVSSDISVDVSNGIDGKVEIRTPYKDVKSAVSHTFDGTFNNFQTTSKLMFNDKEIIAKTQINSINWINGEITLETPFNGYERSLVKAYVVDKNSILTVECEIRAGNSKTTINSKIDRSNGLNAEFCLKTPFTEDFEILLKGNGDDIETLRYEGSVSYGNKKVRGSIDHAWTASSLKGSFLLATPILEDINVEYDLRGNLLSFQSNAKATIGDSNGIQEITSLRISENILELDSTVTTTLTGDSKTTQLVFSHNGGLSNFKSIVKATSGAEEVKMEASFKNLPSIEGTCILQINRENIFTGKFDHSGSLKDFIATGSFEYGSGKKIEANARVNLQRIERMSVNIEMKTPCSFLPHLNGRYMHDLRSDSFSSSAFLSLVKNKPLVDLNLKLTPKMVEFSLTIPENKYSLNGDLAMQKGAYTLSGTAARGIDRIILNFEKSSSSVTISFDTPIKGFESTKIRASATESPIYAALNIQGTYMPEIDFETRLTNLNGENIEGSMTLRTGFTGFRDIRMNMNGQKTNRYIKIHADMFFNRPEGIIIDALSSESETSMSITTPWEFLLSMEGNIKHKWDVSERQLDAATYMKINEKPLYDVDLEVNAKDKKEISLIANVNEPKQMKIEISKIGTPDAFIFVNWNKNDRDSNCRLDKKYNHDWSRTKQIVSFKGTCGSKSYGIGYSYEKPSDADIFSAFFSKDDVRTHVVELQIEHNSYQDDVKMKLQLPTRTLVLTNSNTKRYGSKSSESSFSWDADRDGDKRITVKRTDVSRGDTNEVNLGLEIPSIGKDFKLDAQMRVGDKNVLFDGRTEFKYSPDSRKTLTVNSKLEDVSGNGERYNFLLGISHPYTTVDVQTTAQIGTTDNKLSAELDIKYMTARRQMKNVALMTEIDRLRKQLNVEIRSPLKTMKMDASVATSPYKLTVKNLYDESKPINTELVYDPDQASLDFSMNYDLENPKNSLHVNAKFSDEKGISAELYREENDIKTVDSLFNLRMKTSKILNTRVQWRPSIIRDLKDELTRRVEQYGIRTDRAVEDAYDEVNKEISYKRRLFQAAYSEEVKPYTETIRENMEELRKLKESNAYYLRDISDSLDRVMLIVSNGARDIDEAWNRCPFKQRVDNYIASLEEVQQRLGDYYQDMHIGMGDQLNSIGASSYQTLVDSLNTVKNHRTISLLQSKYGTYMEKLQNFKMNDQISNMAHQYTSTIYNIRENINNGLIRNLPTQVYNTGSSAYKSWEVEENIKALIEKLIDEIKKDLSKEIAVAKNVLGNVFKSKVIVYDLSKGEIEVDLYLPVDVRTLSEIPDISLRKYIPDWKAYIPDTNMFGSLEDYIPHMEFTGHAQVNGNHFTTFDGQQYDFSGRCSYVLARDYVDGNFSIILNFIGRQKKKLILTAHQQSIQLVGNGKIRVDGVVTDLPYKSSDFAVFSDDNKVVIEGNGFQVTSDNNVDKIDIDLSKWYFGKTGGLLGTLNHERYDDMIMPNKQITSDANTLADAWQVQERCR